MYDEIDNSLAGTRSDTKKTLLIGYKTAAGTAEAGKPVQALSPALAAELAGYGSPLAIMAAAYLDINKSEECWLLPVSEPGAGTAWQKTFAVTAAAAGAGTVIIRINGAEHSAAVSAGATAAEIAAAVVARINSEAGLPVEASAGEGGAFTVASLVKGVDGNHNTVTAASGASGVTVTAGAVTQGTGTANIGPLLAALGSVRYHYMVSGFDGAGDLAVLADDLESRYSATRQIGGRAFAALSGGTESVITQAATVNSPHIVLIPRLDNEQLPCVWAARFAAAAILRLASDPAANTYEIPVSGLTAKTEPDFDTRQKLLEAGVATWVLDTPGNVLIERLVTSYTEDPDGARDTSYLDIQVPETVDAVRTYINAEAKRRYKFWKLASTEENFGGGSLVMTAGVFRSFLADLYQTVFVQEKQWCQDFEAYKNSIEVEVKAGSKTRLEYRHRPNLIGQFLIGAGVTRFK
ncbi:MAG: phage tail sheath protein [Treponema sp.]|nr:phage tail sheath protein [Treponema sp.]